MKKFFPAITWLIVVTVLHCIPGKDIPKVGFLENINFDKLVHVGIFAILVFAWCYSFFSVRKHGDNLKKIFWGVALFAFVYGISMELVQHYFISKRSFDLLDITSDGAGILAGLIFSSRRYIKK